MPEPKTYAPISAKLKDNCPFFCVTLGVNVDKMIAFLQQHRNEKGYVNLDLTERRQPSDRGETHSVSLNTWKPKDADWKKAKGQPEPKPVPSSQPAESDDQVPF